MKVIAKIWSIMLPRERKSALYLLALMVVGALFEMLGIGLLVPVMSVIMNPEALANYPAGAQLEAVLGDYGQMAVIIAVLAALVIIYAAKSAFLAFLAWRQADFTYGVLSTASERLFKNYLGRPYEFHVLTNSSGLVRNAITETQTFALNVISPALSLLTEIFVLFGITILLIFIKPIESLTAILTVSFASFLFYVASRKWSLHLGTLRQHHEGLRIKTLQEGLFTVKEIILLGRDQNFLRRYNNHARISAKAAGRQVLIGQLPRLAMEFILVLAFAVFFVTQAYRGLGVDEVLPVLILFAAAAFRLMPSLNRILIALNSLQYGMPVLDLLSRELMGEQTRVTETSIKQVAGAVIREFEFCDINFRYEDGNKNAISDVNLRISGGEMVGFIGPSGAGKSSLIDVFLGLLPPTSGAVLVNGDRINVRSAAWKARIGYVPQHINLVDDSIRRNVAFGLEDADIDDERIEEAIKAAQLNDFIKELADGLDTQVGEHGVRLSGGQRQRIGLARALYGNPEVLVLDEATSALDTETENEVMAAIGDMHGKKTILIIAHRLSTVRACDRIIRMEKGRIVEEGTPATIIAGDINSDDSEVHCTEEH